MIIYAVSIVFSDHAKDKLKTRKISLNVVSKAVYEFEKILPGFKGRKLRRKTIYGKILEVVTVTEGSRITVITAYYLEENL